MIGPLLIMAATLLSACDNEGSQSVADDQQDAFEAIESAASELAPQIADGPLAANLAGDDPLAAVIESHELAPTFISILVDGALLSDPLDLEVIGQAYCEDRSGCRAVVWLERTYLPLALPVEARQTEAAVFAYGIDIAGRETTEWNCTAFPEIRAIGRRCFPTTERLL